MPSVLAGTLVLAATLFSADPEPIPVAPWVSTSIAIVQRSGAISHCTQERSPLAPERSVSCGSRSFGLIRRAAKLFAERDWPITVRASVRMMPSGAALSQVPPGGKLLLQLAVDLRIGPDGKLADCRTVKLVRPPGDNSRAPDCHLLNGPFLADRRAGNQPVPSAARVELMIVGLP